jgi:hypothetical protein
LSDPYEISFLIFAYLLVRSIILESESEINNGHSCSWVSENHTFLLFI